MSRCFRCFSALMVVFCSSDLRADELTDLIPGDAKVVVIVNDMKKLSEGVSAYSHTIGVPLPGEPLAMMEQGGFPAGVVDYTKAAAFVVMQPSENGIALVLPTADPKEALAKLKGQTTGDVTKAEIAGKTHYVMGKEKHLIFAPSEEGLAPFKAPAKNISTVLTGETATFRSGNDLFFFINMPELRPLAEQGLAMGEQFLPVIAQNAPPGQDPEAMKAMLMLYISGAKRIVADTSSIHGGVSITGEKVGFMLAADFTAGSELHGMLMDGKPAAAELLAGLPADPFFVATGLDISRTKNVLLSITKTAIGAMKGKGDPAVQEKILANLTEMMSKAETQTMVVAPAEKGMSIFGLYHYGASDVPGYLKLAKENIELMAKENPFGGGAKFDVKTSTQTIKGAEVLEAVYDFKSMPEQQQKMIEMIYGGQLKMQMGQIDSNAAGFGMNISTDVITKLKGADGFAQEPRIKAAVAALPEKPVMIALVDPFGLFAILKQFKDQIPGMPDIATPAKPPQPFGFAVSTAKDGVVFHANIPAETVGEVKKAFQPR